MKTYRLDIPGGSTFCPRFPEELPVPAVFLTCGQKMGYGVSGGKNAWSWTFKVPTSPVRGYIGSVLMMTRFEGGKGHPHSFLAVLGLHEDLTSLNTRSLRG